MLYPDHFRIIQHVVCGNCGVAQVARMTAPYGMSKAHVEDTGRKMRDGLDRLADLWFGLLPEKARSNATTAKTGSALRTANVRYR